MKTPYALAAILAVLVLSQWSSCGNLSGDESDEADPTPTYTVTYNGNGATGGGTVPADTTHYKAGQTVTVLANTGSLTKAGYGYAGWNTAAGGTGTTYTQGQTFAMGSANVTLYAKWGAEALWARTVSAGPSLSVFLATCVDGSGNVYASGYQYGTDTFTYGGESIMGTSGGWNAILVKYDSSGTVLWAKTISAGSADSGFYALAVDSSGNVYAAGYQNGSGTYTYGGKSITGTYAGGSNAVLVKYDSSGNALWAKTVSAGTADSVFYSAAVDGSGNIYAAGWQVGSGTYTYGTKDATGTNAGGNNVVLVKYDSSGAAQWAKTVSAGSDGSAYNEVVTDGSGNVYAAGWQVGSGPYTYGGQSITGSYAGGLNAVLVKYDSSGTALWARTVSAGGNASVFASVAADGSGNVYASGSQNGSGTYTYGGQSIAGTYAGGSNAVLVKYDSTGTAQWAKTVSAGSNNSTFITVAADGPGNVYAVGTQTGTGVFTYGDKSASGSAGGVNSILVMYDPSGTARWARTTSTGPEDSEFYSIAVDSSRNIYTAGHQNGTDTYTYGGESVTGTYSNSNITLVKWRP